MNRRMLQRQLDLAAEELDRKGHTDLADKVDYCNHRLANMDARGIPMMVRTLERIDREADRRDRKTPPRRERSELGDSRMASLRRRLAMRRRSQNRYSGSDSRRHRLAALARRVRARRQATSSRRESGCDERGSERGNWRAARRRRLVGRSMRSRRFASRFGR